MNYIKDINTATYIFDECGYSNIDEYADVMTLKSFVRYIKDGLFIDYDGSGEIVIDDKVVNQTNTDINKGLFTIGNSKKYVCIKFKDLYNMFGERVKVAWYNK